MKKKYIVFGVLALLSIGYYLFDYFKNPQELKSRSELTGKESREYIDKVLKKDFRERYKHKIDFGDDDEKINENNFIEDLKSNDPRILGSAFSTLVVELAENRNTNHLELGDELIPYLVKGIGFEHVGTQRAAISLAYHLSMFSREFQMSEGFNERLELMSKDNPGKNFAKYPGIYKYESVAVALTDIVNAGSSGQSDINRIRAASSLGNAYPGNVEVTDVLLDAFKKAENKRLKKETFQALVFQSGLFQNNKDVIDPRLIELSKKELSSRSTELRQLSVSLLKEAKPPGWDASLINRLRSERDQIVYSQILRALTGEGQDVNQYVVELSQIKNKTKDKNLQALINQVINSGK